MTAWGWQGISLALCLLSFGLMFWDWRLEVDARGMGKTPPYLKMGNLRVAVILMLAVAFVTGCVGLAAWFLA